MKEHLEAEQLLLKNIKLKSKWHEEKEDELVIGQLIIAILEIKKEAVEKDIQKTLQPNGILPLLSQFLSGISKSK